MKEWIKRSVVYQIYPRSFMDSNGDGIGDLNGITSKLSYVKDLGADIIWLNPIYPSPNDDMGYDIMDYRDIMPEFGTLKDFELLLSKAHDLGLKIMLDLVVNHTSDEHQWFKASVKREGKYEDFYIWRDKPNNWGASFQGSAWEYVPERGQYYLHTFSKKQPDLNWNNPHVREEVYSLMEFWLDKGVDGFRMDVINYISKPDEMPDGPQMPNGYGDFHPFCLNGHRQNEFLKEMNARVLSRYNCVTVGETVMVKPQHALEYANLDGSELDMVFHFQHMGVDHGKYGKWSSNRFDFIKLRKILSNWQEELNGKAWNSLYWDNHDQPRYVSRFGDDSTEEYRRLSAKMLATCLYLMQGTPYILYGDELGMTNVAFDSIGDYKDIDSIRAFKAYTEKGVPSDEMMSYIHKHSRDNGRTPMQWDKSKNAGFSESEPWLKINPNYKYINVESQLDDPDSVYTYFKKLLAFRKSSDAIIDGQYLLTNKEMMNIFSYDRILGDVKIHVFCNFSAEDSTLIDFKGTKVLGNYSDLVDHLRAYETVVLEETINA